MKKLLIILAMFLSTGVFADEARCVKGAQFVESVGYVRDSHVSLEDAKQMVVESFGNDKVLLQITEIVYNNPDVTPLYLARDFYSFCMKNVNNSI